MLFVKHNNQTVEFSDAELAQSLSRLDASNSRYCLGHSDVAFVNTGGGLLLIDASWPTGRRLLEQYLIGSNTTLPFGISFSLGSASYTLAQALAGVGYVGLSTIAELSQVFMAKFGGSAFQGPPGENGLDGAVGEAEAAGETGAAGATG